MVKIQRARNEAVGLTGSQGVARAASIKLCGGRDIKFS